MHPITKNLEFFGLHQAGRTAVLNLEGNTRGNDRQQLKSAPMLHTHPYFITDRRSYPRANLSLLLACSLWTWAMFLNSRHSAIS